MARTREAVSVFHPEAGYIPTAKAYDFTVISSGYFTINDIGQDALDRLRLSGIFEGITNKESAADGSFWQIVITDIQETHEESYSLHNTISDNVAVFATGAKPIAVSIRGYVLISDTDDHNYILLRNYVDHFRARHLSARGATLTFRSQDTAFKLIIESVSLGHSIEFETYVSVALSGLAYDYGQTDSCEHLDLSYYGKTRSTPAGMKDIIKDEAGENNEEKNPDETLGNPPYQNQGKGSVSSPKPFIK